MSLEKINKIKGKGVFVSGNDIDTDRVIPARFMKCVTFEGLGQYAFYDARFDSNGNLTGHPLDSHRSASVLISGNNFGCGSSREHAPQALYHWGIRAIIAESFAEIFFGNAITLGIPCLKTSQSSEIGALAEKNPDAELEIDLENKLISLAGKQFNFEIPEEARLALIKGEWDPIALLLKNKDEIAQLEKRLLAKVKA